MIVFKDVNKKIGNKPVINNCTFHIRQGECVGLLGKNGAGKTTLLNLMAGILEADNGFLRINGSQNPLKDTGALKELVYISGIKSQLWQDIKIKDSFRHCQNMYGVKNDRLEELTSLCNISHLLDEYPVHLSLGEKMRCEIVYALLADPSILLMDEVMLGLDVTIKQKIFEYLQKMKKAEDITIIYTSHNLMEVERLCERILLINQGNIIFDGSKERLMREYAPLYQMQIVLKDNVIPDFEDLPVRKIDISNNRICVFFSHNEIEKAELLRFITNKYPVNDIRLIEPGLEDTIRQIG